MAKEVKKKEVEKSTGAELAVVGRNYVNKSEGGRVLSTEELGALLKTASQGNEITAEMYDFEEGETLDCFVIGTKKLPPMEEGGSDVTAILALNEDGKKIILYDAMLRNNLIDYVERSPYGVRITCVGMKTSKKNTTRKFKDFMINELVF